MKPVIIVFLSAFLTLQSFGQESSCFYFEEEYFNIIERINTARTHHFKTISVVSFDNYKARTGQLALRDTFDMDGKLLKRFEDFTDSKELFPSYTETEYSYNDDGLLSKINSKTIESWRLYLGTKCIEIGYSENNKPNFQMYKSSDSIEDANDYTVFYSYHDDGSVESKYLINKGDTICHQYDSAGVLIEVEYQRNKVVNKTKFEYCGDKLSGNLLYDPTSKLQCVIVRDSACNVLLYKYEYYSHHKWNIISKTERNYKEGKLTELKWSFCDETFYSECTGKLKFGQHIRYEYNPLGLVSQEISLSKSGKIIGVKEYIYELY